MSGNDESEPGTAGSSARREHRRRRAAREDLVRAKHRRLGRLILALQDAPAHERAWERGARGEEHVAASLARRLNADVRVLHDRRIPGTRANIDHIAVAASGVWVVDAKQYRGKIAVTSPLFGEPKLTIAGRDRSALVEGLARQVELVGAALAAAGAHAPVHGALCFVDADMPLIRTLAFKGFPLLHPRRLAKRINAPGPVTPQRASQAIAALTARFPAA